MLTNDQKFVLTRYPDVICDKLFEEDNVTYDFGIIRPDNSYVFGSGKTEDEAWRSAVTNILIGDRIKS